MYLSNRDLEYAHKCSDLLIDPPPAAIGPSSIDLRLDSIEHAKVWNLPGFEEAMRSQGATKPRIELRGFAYKKFSDQYLIPIPVEPEGNEPKVYREDNRVILAPGGFLLWQTKEAVGTPEANARYICFINGRSSFARLGLVIHLTAPTIEAGWWGHVTLEIANFGQFRLVLQEDDIIAQIVVAMISSPPQKDKAVRGIDVGQKSVGGRA